MGTAMIVFGVMLACAGILFRRDWPRFALLLLITGLALALAGLLILLLLATN